MTKFGRSFGRLADAAVVGRHATMIAVSRASLEDIERYRKRMGWQFRWVSSNGNSFNHDFKVSFAPEEVATGHIDYNFGEWQETGDEWPGLSAFYKNEAGEIFHTYSTYGVSAPDAP